MTTSDVYFDGGYMPWRPADDRRVAPVVPVAAHAADDPPALAPPPAEDSPPAPQTVQEAYDLATRGARATARSSKRVLILFSGSYSRPDGLGAYLTKLGLEAVMVDNDGKRGGNNSHDLLDDSFYRKLLERVESGEFCAIFAAPPCGTFSISRFFTKGPSPVRDRANILGLANLSSRSKRELTDANTLVSRTCHLLSSGWRVGTQFVLENPVDRGDRSQQLVGGRGSTRIDARILLSLLMSSTSLIEHVPKLHLVQSD